MLDFFECPSAMPLFAIVGQERVDAYFLVLGQLLRLIVTDVNNTRGASATVTALGTAETEARIVPWPVGLGML